MTIFNIVIVSNQLEMIPQLYAYLIYLKLRFGLYRQYIKAQVWFELFWKGEMVNHYTSVQMQINDKSEYYRSTYLVNDLLEIWNSVQFVQDHFCQRFDSRSGLFLISYNYVIYCVIFTN
ncbi:Hypothetical_protein [Hexamita inflata]|uniref:Hypothetical_protein n=1 Tax=Hexamita inflata TaxID=28002 RepID=A0ABP1HB59_9EUKA